MKKTIVTIVVILFSNALFAQIGGISASKLSALCTQTVGNKDIEFEPAFSIIQSKKYWDSDGKLQNIYSTTDSFNIESGLGFRFSYGVSDNLESGFSVSSDMSGLSWGTKYHYEFNENFGIAPAFGINLPLGNRVADKKDKNAENIGSYAGGIIISKRFSENFTTDVHLVGQKYFRETADKHKNDLFLSWDMGYFIGPVQAVCGLAYSKSAFENNNFNSNKLTLNLGTTLERSENFLLVLYAPIDIMGKNTAKTIGFGFALTATIH